MTFTYVKDSVGVFTLNFNSYGGSSIAPIMNFEGQIINKPDDPIRKDYKFDGWYYDHAFQTKVSWPLKLNDNYSLYANWIPAATITFVTNGGTYVAPITDAIGTRINKPENPTKEGKNFISWHRNQDLNQPVFWPIELDNNYTFYAEWKEDTHYYDRFAYTLTERGAIIDKYLGNNYNVLVPEVILEKEVYSLNDRSFENCSFIEYITLPKSIESLGYYSFYNCSALTSIIITETIQFIDSSAFRDCSSLVIYTEFTSRPSGWNQNWNPNNRPVYWKDQWHYHQITGVPTPNYT